MGFPRISLHPESKHHDFDDEIRILREKPFPQQRSSEGIALGAKIRCFGLKQRWKWVSCFWMLPNQNKDSRIGNLRVRYGKSYGLNKGKSSINGPFSSIKCSIAVLNYCTIQPNNGNVGMVHQYEAAFGCKWRSICTDGLKLHYVHRETAINLTMETTIWKILQADHVPRETHGLRGKHVTPLVGFGNIISSLSHLFLR